MQLVEANEKGFFFKKEMDTFCIVFPFLGIKLLFPIMSGDAAKATFNLIS